MRRTTTSTRAARPIHACASCRKMKTRCEILEPRTTPVRCHRCKVLAIECSYGHTQVPITRQRLGAENASMMRRTDPSSGLMGFVAPEKDVDWSAPMLAIQHLTPSATPSTTAPTNTNTNADISLSGMLPECRIDHLLDLFTERYTPWLNFRPTKHAKSPLVDIACAAVAARHLDGAVGREVHLRLQTLARDSVAQMIFTPGAAESLEAVQCLLILALWGPFGEAPEARGWEPWALISEAVRVGVSLRLDRASAVVDAMRKGASSDDVEHLPEAQERARLWIAVTNAESMLGLGTGHASSSRRSPSDYQLVHFPAVFNAQTALGDVRLGLTGRQFDLFDQGVAMCLQEGSELKWAAQINNVLQGMNQVERLLRPLPVILSSEQIFFRALQIPHGTARMLVLYRAFREARASVAHIPLGQPWHTRFMPRAGGQELLLAWGADMIQSGEAALVCALSMPAPHLCTAPDALFNMLAFSAAYLVGAKLLMLRLAPGHGLLGASDLVLVKVIPHLHRAACGPGHAAERCALFIQSLVAKWKARDVTQPNSSYPTPPKDFRPLDPPAAVPSTQGAEGPSAVDMDFFFLDSMLSDTTALWDSLAQEQLLW
ncbi:hypothetical protein FB451DRAFT_1367315 [Mycena latifolia]|nr:hypothetical protein FB451DRAFT_1367315 [Mycena latifolia]